jgi:hypothetical protein
MGVTTVATGYERGFTIPNDAGEFRGKQADNRGYPGGGQVTVASNTVQGVGWGATKSFTVAGVETRPTFTIVSAGGTYAQATATMTHTFPGGAYSKIPNVFARVVSGSDLGIIISSVTTTGYILTAAVVPAGATTVVEVIVLPTTRE